MLSYELRKNKYTLYFKESNSANYSQSMIKLKLIKNYGFNMVSFHNNNCKIKAPKLTDFKDSYGYQELYFDTKKEVEEYIELINSVLLAIKLCN